MTAQVVTRCEVYMSEEEQRMLLKVTDWIDETLNCTDDCDVPDLPDGIIEILDDIYDNIHLLLELIPDEH